MGMTYTTCSICGQSCLITDFDRYRFGDICDDCRAAQHAGQECSPTQKATRAYKIFQLDLTKPEAIQIIFRPLSKATAYIEQGFQLAYDLLYSGEVTCGKDWSDGQVLERLFRIFNFDHPADYKGHSLSISDIICLDGVKFYYCEPVGFALLPFTPAIPDGG